MHDQRKSIKQWSEQDKPREKLISQGADALSDSELLAILISTGTKELTALDVARNLLNVADNNLHHLAELSFYDLKKIKGIGEAKAISILAAIELGNRRKYVAKNHKSKITSSKESVVLFERMRSSKQEEFWIACFNRQMVPVYVGQVHIGGISSVSADPRIIFRTALEHHATSVIVAHNHPSGVARPSKSDEEITENLKSAGAILEIKLADHLILTTDGYFSFSDAGMI